MSGQTEAARAARLVDDRASLGTVIDESVDPAAPLGIDNFKELVTKLIAHAARSDSVVRVMEAGGGRTPLFEPSELEGAEVEYWVNDISQRELDELPSAYRTLCLDISDEAGTRGAGLGTFDVIFSRSLLEHVGDTDAAIRNVRSMLAPSGVMLHCFPTLWNPVFVANRLMPERLSAKVLRDVVHFHNEKFPARYHRTTSGEYQSERLRRLGLEDVTVRPYWGHNYFHFLPALQRNERRFAELARRRDWRWYSSYCFIAARAPACVRCASRANELTDLAS